MFVVAIVTLWENNTATHYCAYTKSDSSLFIQKGPRGPVCILLYVDDLVATNPDLAEIGKVKSQLLDTFKMKDLGDLHYSWATKLNMIRIDVQNEDPDRCLEWSVTGRPLEAYDSSLVRRHIFRSQC